MEVQSPPSLIKRGIKVSDCVRDGDEWTEGIRQEQQLVQGSVVQLLVLGRSRGEDGGHRQHGGGPGRVPHLVDHDGGQGHAQDLQDKGRSQEDRRRQEGDLPSERLTASTARVKTTPIMMSMASRM